MNSQVPRPSMSGRSLRKGLLTALVAMGLTQIGCVVHSRPVYVVEQAPPPPPATTVVTASGDVVVDDFYAPLSNYGVWVYAPGYGRVWQPASEFAGPGFTPYASHGRWVMNEYGDWVFVSRYDAQWGWATYHYGRWAWTDYYGWVWVPGVEWAPAWVEWRYGGGYVGWVPMGPPGYVIVEEHWVFVEHGYVCSEGVVEHRLPPERARAAYTAASPVIATKGDSHYRVGPPKDALVSAGVEIHTEKVQPPPPGYVRTQAKLVDDAAADRRVTGKVPSQPMVRAGATLPAGAGIAAPPAAGAGQSARPGAVGGQDAAAPQVRPDASLPPSQQNGQPMPQPAPNPGPTVGPRPGIDPQPMPSQPSVQPQPRPQPQPMPQPQPQRPTVTPPAPRPTAAPAPRPAPRPSAPAPRPTGKRR